MGPPGLPRTDHCQVDVVPANPVDNSRQPSGPTIDRHSHFRPVARQRPEGMRQSQSPADRLDRKPVALSITQTLPSQATAGARVDVWVAQPDAKNGFSEPKLILPGAEIAEVTTGSTALGSSKTTVLMVLVEDKQMPALLGAQANDAKISVVWNPGGVR